MNNEKNFEEKELLRLQELHRRQMKENRDKTLARKQRTRRLITRGAFVESMFSNAESMTDEEFQIALRSIFNAAQRAACPPPESCGSNPQ